MTTGAPATIYGSFSESAERGRREAQRIQELIDAAGSVIAYIRGPGPDIHKKGKAKGKGK